MISRLTTIVAITTIATSCTENGANYNPILDGPESELYQSDLADCQGLAANQYQLNEEVVGAAVAGGLFGSLVADHDGKATAVEGLIAGALVAYVTALFDAGDQREAIIVACMQGRGHRVVG